MKKIYIYEKCVDLVECNISRKNHITHDVRPSNCCATAHQVLFQNFWRALVYTNLIDSHRRVEGVTFGNCKMNRLLFAVELVLHAWIVSIGSPARISLVFYCVRPSRNKKQYWSDWGIMSLKTPKAVYSARERKYTAAGGEVQASWGSIYEWRKSEQRHWYTDWWSKLSSAWASLHRGCETGAFKDRNAFSL